MKKLAAFFMGVVFITNLCACGAPSENNSNSGSNVKNSSVASEKETSASNVYINSKSETSSKENDVDSGKTLVVYYSASGNTQSIANYIVNYENADVFEIKPVEPYTNDDLNWTDDNSRVVIEHDNPDKRVVELEKNTVDNWEDYDTVFVGYPIWWGIAAWPMDDFIKSNDFTGKTVIPFCTSASSGLGESGKLLSEMAGTGNWLEGERFSSEASEKDVTDWLDTLK